MLVFFLAKTKGIFLDGRNCEEGIMTQHPSFTRGGAVTKKRSVLKRHERVDLLKKRGQLSDPQCVIGLPKTKPED